MLASTSRAVLRTSLRACQAPAFSTSAVHAKKNTMIVELLEDVEGLGGKYDRVPVSKGYMRHNLAPFRLARYIPWKNAAEKPVVDIKPRLRPSPSSQKLISQFGGKKSGSSAPAEPTPTELLGKLHLLPATLVFKRRTISPTTPALHGSITMSDIYERLTQDHSLSSSEVQIDWVEQDNAARMKELGTWPLQVEIVGYGEETVNVFIEAVREE